ncbi:Ferritin-like domain-containing protein [Halorubrum aquaticum]|uniref:Ferritin-like domain-containing protein n=1 Tax=Halorubrum aquaticum TaxID=387340 RepID=A0A1I3BPB1_9EURY|nr:ferritin-like domain-containing protein [Halorubrum aquaticum]SFH64073.1 Ferritin-like domain-containing protein [Halorubrum aquaticum]
MTEIDDSKARAERIAESVKERMEDGGSSRRGFLNRSLLAGGTLLALGTGTGFAMSHDEDDAAHEPSADFDDVAGTDLDVLNYALTLENLENAFYREGLDMFDENDFAQAEHGRDLADLSTETAEGVQAIYDHVEVIGGHETAHVEVLGEAITLLGGEPEPELSYDFGVETVDGFLATAQVFENTGVAAYAGAAPFIESPDLQSAALSIHSVEARHAAFLNDVNGESFFPDAFDSSLSQQAVLDAVAPVIESDERETGNGAENGNGNSTDAGNGNGNSTDAGNGNGNSTDAGNGTETGD